MQSIEISTLPQQSQELINQILAGEELIITADEQPVAKIVRLDNPSQTQEQSASQRKRRQAGLTKGAAWMSPDFDEPLEEFAEYM